MLVSTNVHIISLVQMTALILKPSEVKMKATNVTIKSMLSF